jgi:hypothetical protein
VASEKISVLTRRDITLAARTFQWRRQMPKWTVIVDGRELPARPLVLEAAGVPPNDPTNSHQAVAILKERGFQIRYDGKSLDSESEHPAPPITEDYIRGLRGCCKGEDSLVEALIRERRNEK